jgi:hypothetical protein
LEDFDRTCGVETMKKVMILAGAVLCTKIAGEADAYVEQGIEDTKVDFDLWKKPECITNWRAPDSFSDLISAASGNGGILGINQASGNANNQANSVAQVFTGGPADIGSLAHAMSEVEQDIDDSDYYGDLVLSTSQILGSVTGNTGLVGVNQSSGSQNNQANTVAMAAGINTYIALSVTDIDQCIDDYDIQMDAGISTAVINGSVTSNVGIVGVNQSSGNGNNQANTVSFAGNIP